MQRIARCLILTLSILLCLFYLRAFQGQPVLGLWDGWLVFQNASRIKISPANLEAKLELNAAAILFAPTPWLVKQRVALLTLDSKEKNAAEIAMLEQQLWIVWKEKAK